MKLFGLNCVLHFKELPNSSKVAALFYSWISNAWEFISNYLPCQTSCLVDVKVSVILICICYMTNRAYQVILVVKTPPANARDVQDTGSVPGLECRLEGAWQPMPIFLLENPMSEDPSGLRSVGSQRVGHDWNNLARVHAQMTNICTDYPSLEICLDLLLF